MSQDDAYYCEYLIAAGSSYGKIFLNHVNNNIYVYIQFDVMPDLLHRRHVCDVDLLADVAAQSPGRRSVS